MPSIPFPPNSMPGAYPAEGQGRLVNCYAQKDGDQVSWRRVPGLVSFVDTGEQTPRGLLQVGSLLYGAYDGKCVTITQGGVVTELSGNLNGTGRVSIAQNNAATPDVVIVDPNEGAFSVSTSSVIAFADGDLPQPVSVASLNGYLLFAIANGEIWSTGLNDVTVDPLAFAKAESNPDGLLRGVSYGGVFLAMGQSTIEVWQDNGDSPFPLIRSQVIPLGLLGTNAVAGFEAGWGGPLIWATSSDTVVRLDGYQPTRISTPDVERAIASVSNRDTIEADVYVVRGHMFFCLSCPLWTWVYNVSTGLWHEQKSYGVARWKIGKTTKAFGRWVGCDRDGGKIYTISEAVQTEGDDPIVVSLTSGNILGFPNQAAFPRVDFRFVVGLARESGPDPIVTEPQVSVSWSDDGGATWGVPLLRSLGRQGEYERRVSVHRTGRMSRNGRRFKLEVSDPVDVVFLGGEYLAEVRRD